MHSSASPPRKLVAEREHPEGTQQNSAVASTNQHSTGMVPKPNCRTNRRHKRTSKTARKPQWDPKQTATKSSPHTSPQMQLHSHHYPV